MENAPFGITREDVLNLTAQKLVNAYDGDPDLSELAEKLIREKVKELFAEKLTHRIDTFLNGEMEKLLGQEIVPVNIWGEREGSPTTLRAELANRAKQFWEVSVNNEGKPTTYGGYPRSQVLMQQILKDEFAQAVKSNADVIVAEFKKALTADATKLVTDHINKLIQVKNR